MRCRRPVAYPSSAPFAVQQSAGGGHRVFPGVFGVVDGPHAAFARQLEEWHTTGRAFVSLFQWRWKNLQCPPEAAAAPFECNWLRTRQLRAEAGASAAVRRAIRNARLASRRSIHNARFKTGTGT